MAWASAATGAVVGGRVFGCAADCSAYFLGGGSGLDPAFLRAGPGRHLGSAGYSYFGYHNLRLGLLADALQILAAIRGFLLLVWAGLGVGCNGTDRGCVANGARQRPGVDESAYAISRQRVLVHRGSCCSARNGLEAFARGGGGSVDKKRAAARLPEQAAPSLRTALRLRRLGHGAVVGGVAGSDRAIRPRVGPIHHVLSAGNRRGGFLRFRARGASHAADGSDCGLLDSPAGWTVRHRIAH